MKKWIVLFFIPWLFGASLAYGQVVGTLPTPADPIKEKLIKFAIRKSLRLLVAFEYTAILSKPDDGGVLPQSIKRNADDDRLSFPVDLPPKAIMKFKTAGIFDFKLKWDLHSRGLGTVTGLNIHCKNLLGEDAGVGVTLYAKGLFKNSFRNQHGTIKAPDENNACEWKDMLDVFVALELNRAYVSIQTEENPDGEVLGDIANIGF